ncbi:MAG: F0F1 ATP synthase subunit delta [Rickettsiaceae bacterium]|nr:F0F1 ATP synthase subunit delta [Rickettsiaceae bacterium]
MKKLDQKFSSILIALAGDTKSLEDLIKILKNFDEIMKQNHIFRMFMSSPIIHQGQKQDVIEKIGKTMEGEAGRLVTNLLVILTKLKKMNILSSIIENLELHTLKDKGFSKTWVLFTNKPTEKQIKMVDNILTNQFGIKPQINVKVNEYVVAGFIAFFNGKMLDASLHNTFEDFANLQVD